MSDLLPELFSLGVTAVATSEYRLKSAISVQLAG